MTVRGIMFAAAAVSAATMAVAQPPQPNVHPASQQDSRPAEVVMASADRLPNAENPAAEAQPASAPAPRKRTARVTSCRCGDPGQ